jgi:hypothetical protein
MVTALEILDNAIAGTEMQVDVVAALPAGTNNIGDVDVLSIVPGTAATNLGKAEDAAHSTGDTGVMALAVRKDTAAASSGTTGDYEPLATDATGRLWIVGAGIEDAAETAGGTLLMAGSVRRDTAASSAGTTGDNATINTDSVGALWTRDTTTQADDAAFTLGTTRAIPISGIAVATDGTDPTVVSAEGDVAALRTDLQRILLVNQTHPRGTTVSADYAAAQTNTSVIAAPGAGLSIYITDITISNGATAGNITLLDGSGGTVRFEIYPAINGGVDKQLRQPIKLTANTALCITSTTVTTHSIFIGYYIAA